jgi:hypothetical protein
MAFQIDPSIPLQAQRTTFDPASILMQAQTNAANLEKHRFEMQKLREDYDAQKEARKQQKAMQMGIASDLAGIQSGTPAQYAPPRFEQTPQRGQMPQGMTGVMMREQGQQMPQAQAFGEEILNGDFRLGGGEVTQEAVAGRQPTYAEMLAIGLKQAMLTKNQDEIFKYAKAIQETEKQATKWGMNPTKGINPQTMQPDYFVVNELGQKQFLGVNPYEAPKDIKTSLVKTSKGFEVVREGELPIGTPPVDAPAPEKPISGYQKIKLEGELRDDYRKDSSNFVEISRQARIIQDSLKDDSAAGTLASATAFMKMLDPGSVVRESELAMAMKTNGALDRMGNYINVIQSGQVLTTQQKADFAKLIKTYSNAANEAQRNLNKKYGQISSEYGLDPKRVVVYDVQKDDKPEKVDAKVTPQTKIVKTRADLDKVKSGETYIAPDGKPWVKP